MESKIKFLAYYLPQYHQIPENDEWWEPGFTEWTNVTKAKPLFKGHHQPNLPSELGFYDLRVPDVQRKQSNLALEHKIDGFIYYQYWFGNGKMLLEKPAEMMLKDDKITIPFCFCWANESWRGVMHGLDRHKILIEQTYSGEKDYIDYFNYLIPFFMDDRYIKINDCPMFHIYRLDDIPDPEVFFPIFEEMAIKNGFKGMYFVATGNVNSKAVTENESIKGVVGLDIFKKLRYNKYHKFLEGTFLHRLEKIWNQLLGESVQLEKRRRPMLLDYEKGLDAMQIHFPHEKYISSVLPNWDNSPRSKNQSMVLINSSPANFEIAFTKFAQQLKNHPENPPFIVIKSWNEWAEGNYLEPDRTYGRGWLQAVKNVKMML